MRLALLSLEMTIVDSKAEATDGRQARSERTRSSVAEAMLDCLQEGVLRPSARQVGERAGVSTRAVFRHFQNMEALLEEAARLQIERVMSALPPIVSGGTLDERVESIVSHSARRNEIVAPVRRAALLSEPFSEVIRARQAWMRGQARKQICAVFAPELAALPAAKQRERITALRALLSFSYWEELRRHGRLSNAAATRVLRGAVKALILA